MSDDQDTFSELLEAYLEKIRSGNAPAPEDYAAQHPAFAAELQATLPILLDIEHIGNSRDEPQSPNMPLPDFSGTDFRLLRKIGSGGMGVVYEALQVSLDRKVAIKVLSPTRPVEDVALNRLENEARIIAQLYHPNIVKVFTAGHLGGSFFYAMELLGGTDLSRHPPTTPHEIAKVGLEAARALAYAHGCGVLHCDVKPSNIFLGADGILKIGDFGLALSAEECGNTSVRDGTLRYMAPERLAQKQIDFASDQYSLGATLYEFIARQPLHGETDMPRLLYSVRHPQIRFPKGYDPDLSAVIMKSLSVDPSDRYPSLSDFADDLQRYLDHRPVLAAQPSSARRLLLWAKRDPIRATACAFAIVCAFGFTATLAVGLVNTRRAMERARKNASTANNALQVVFRHVAKQPPSPADAQLLDELLPYHENISNDAQLTSSARATVYDTLVRCALRSGKYDLAEKFLRNLIALRGYDANCQSHLAFSLQRQGRKQEADAIWNELATRFATHGSPDDQAVAARALINVADDASSPNYRLAFDILKHVLSKDPTNQKARLEYARMLLDECPFAKDAQIPDVPSDPVAILDELTAQNPQRVYFAVLRMNAIYARFCKKLDDNDMIKDEEATHMLVLAEDLFTRFENHPGVALLVFRVRKAHQEHVRQNFPPPRISRHHGQFLEFCRSIFNSPNVPEQDKSDILEEQLDDLATITDRPRMFMTDSQIIKTELDKFTGKRAGEFKERLAALQKNVPEPLPFFPHRPPRRWHGEFDGSLPDAKDAGHVP